jgi:hypothetical protein
VTVVDESWEIIRMRTVKAKLLSKIEFTPLLDKIFLSAPKRVKETLHQLSTKVPDDPRAATELSALWTTTIETISFTEKDLTEICNSTASEIVKNIEHFERIDRLIASAATRRNNALHESIAQA